MGHFARIDVALGMDTSDFLRKTEEAEKRAQTFSGRVSAAFDKAFTKGRGPRERGGNALAKFAGDLAGGDVTSALTGLALRMTGFGAVAAVAVQTVSKAWENFKTDLDETKAAAEAVRKELLTPINVTLGLNQEGLKAATSRASEAVEKLGEKLSPTAGQGFLRNAAEAIKGVVTQMGQFGHVGGGEGKSSIQQARDLNQLDQNRKQFMQQQVDLADQLAYIKEQELTGDTHLAAQSKIALESEQKKAAIRSTPGMDPAQARKAIEVVERETKLALDVEGKRYELKNQSLEAEEKMAKLVRAGLSPEELKKARAALDIAGLDREIAQTQDPLAKRGLQLQKFQRQTELRDMSKEERNPFAQGTIAARDFESSKGGFGTIAARAKETDDPTTFGSLAFAATQRGEKPEAQPKDNSVVGILQQILTVTQQAWSGK